MLITIMVGAAWRCSAPWHDLMSKGRKEEYGGGRHDSAPLGAVENASLEKAGEKRTIVPLGTVEDASLGSLLN